jgi:hypothetical protein
MPVIFKHEGLRFHFYSNEGDPREPMHVHVAGSSRDAKFWLYPEVQPAYNRGFDGRTITRLVKIVAARRTEIAEAWHEHFTKAD